MLAIAANSANSCSVNHRSSARAAKSDYERLENSGNSRDLSIVEVQCRSVHR